MLHKIVVICFINHKCFALDSRCKNLHNSAGSLSYFLVRLAFWVLLPA